MLRRHIISNYGETYELNSSIRVRKSDDRSIETRTLRNSCVDEIMGTTMLTESVEASDADEMALIELSRETRSIETSDPDDFNYSYDTRVTFTVETSDPDEFNANPIFA